MPATFGQFPAHFRFFLSPAKYLEVLLGSPVYHIHCTVYHVPSGVITYWSRPAFALPYSGQTKAHLHSSLPYLGTRGASVVCCVAFDNYLFGTKLKYFTFLQWEIKYVIERLVFILICFCSVA